MSQIFREMCRFLGTGNKEMKNIKIYSIIISLFILITLFVTFPVITKMNTSVYGPIYGTDYRGAVRHCWWVSYAFDNNLDWRVDNMVNYPFGDKYDWSIVSPIWQLSGYALSIIFNEHFAFNSIFIMSFILSAITMFLLSFYITRDYKSSFLAGLIYGFCPYHFNKIWEHLGLAIIEWMPLYVLCLLRLRKHGKFKDIIFCAITFSLVVFSDYYYAYFMSVFTLGWMAFLLFYKWRPKLYSLYQRKWSDFRKWLKLDYQIFKRVIAVGFFTFIFTLPATYSILKTMLFASGTEQAIGEGFVRPFHYLFAQSARLFNYFLPASAHPVFGGFTKSMFGSIFYGRGPIEQTLYLGYIPLILAFIAYRNWKRNKCETLEAVYKKQDDFVIGFFIFSAIFAFLFSLPPYLNLGLFKIYFPSYFGYKILPMFRAYARFGIIVMLAVSVLAAVGLKYVLNRIKTPRKRLALTGLLAIIILFEFLNIPPSRVTDMSQAPAVYQWLAKQEGNFAIAEYPIKLGDGAEGYVNLDYLLYQRVHQKAILNGARPATKAYTIKKKIAKIVDPKAPQILKGLGIKYVVIHLNEYRQGNSEEAVDVIGEIPDFSKLKGLKLVKQFGEDEVYEIIAKELKVFD